MTEPTIQLEGESTGAAEAVEVVDTPAVKPAKAAKAAKAAKGDEAPVEVIVAAQSKRVKILLEENDNIPPTGLFIGINGRSYMLRPGEEVEVPVEVVEVLNDAIESVPRQDANHNVVEYRNKMRFPYRILSR